MSQAGNRGELLVAMNAFLRTGIQTGLSRGLDKDKRNQYDRIVILDDSCRPAEGQDKTASYCLLPKNRIKTTVREARRNSFEKEPEVTAETERQVQDAEQPCMDKEHEHTFGRGQEQFSLREVLFPAVY